MPHGYLGEYCWHPLYREIDGWARPNSWRKIPVATQPLDTEYLAKQCEFDYSLGEGFRFRLPSPGLVTGLNLRLCDGKNVSYADAAGKVLFFDPSTKEEGPSAALINRTALLQFLRGKKFEAVWIVTCSKETSGGRRHGSGWGGERRKTSIYWMTAKGFSHTDHEERRRPSAAQLKEFLNGRDTAKRSVKCAAADKSHQQPKNVARSRAQKAKQRKRQKTQRASRPRVTKVS
jgi:hypothetical protein